MTKTNFKTKKVRMPVVIAIVLAVSALVGVVGYLSSGYKDMDVKGWIYERNPDNLFDYSFDTVNVDDGVKMSVDKYGVINVKGFVADTGRTEEKVYKLGTIELPAGTYVLSTTEGNSSMNTIMLYGIIEGDSNTWYADNTSSMVRTFDAKTKVTFKVGVYKDDCDVNFTIHPILNEGTEPLEDFFVIRASTK